MAIAEACDFLLHKSKLDISDIIFDIAYYWIDADEYKLENELCNVMFGCI